MCTYLVVCGQEQTMKLANLACDREATQVGIPGSIDGLKVSMEDE